MPCGLTLTPDESIPVIATSGQFGMTHGPLCLPDVSPIIFYGPQCKVLNAPFTVKLRKAPSPKVGVPFCVTYEIKNNTAKNQTLVYSLNSAHTNTEDRGTISSTEQVLINGKVKGEVQLSPFENKSFLFSCMSMAAGKVRCPNFSLSSSRYQTLVINDVNDRYFFVLP